MTITAGLDVGGAHLKLAVADGGQLMDVRQIVCPLWKGLDKLQSALSEARPLLADAATVGVTMTGELSDLFPDRARGVDTLVSCLADTFGDKASFWMGRKGFGEAAIARNHPLDVGSTNFLATAAFIGGRVPEALLVDFGSTTADVVPIADGRPVPRGVTDGERLGNGELVYTGLTRTAVMGVSTRAPFKGRMQSLAREYLATMADVRRILGDLPDDVDQHDTADGRGKSVDESLGRLARMFGRDNSEGDLAVWQTSAAFLADVQLRSILEGCRQVLAANPMSPAAPIIAAGIGAKDVGAVAGRLGRQFIPFAEVARATESTSLWATRCAPAASAALLLAGPLSEPEL
jgi:(4-(4-[2-(gamma-L-glutamylamino)ethyl]phenoxymethyl)furan-2-yl)methanamine synthase